VSWSSVERAQQLVAPRPDLDVERVVRSCVLLEQPAPAVGTPEPVHSRRDCLQISVLVTGHRPSCKPSSAAPELT
jgi:hypothetical protein